MKFSEEAYEGMLQDLFRRFPSFQNVGRQAYKPGLDNMMAVDALMEHPHGRYPVIHVAGTNGKGSVSNMLVSALAACGMKVGLYTSPHILDFRERMRVVYGETHVEYVPKEYVWNFIRKWELIFDSFGMSFFEITTLMAMNWFSSMQVDVAVIETGLGGRLDSTNIVTPVLSVITNIGLDHCDLLGETLPEIAFEKAGIIKPKIPVVVGESSPEIDQVFERKVLYVNISEQDFMGDRNKIMSLLTFADRVEPVLWDEHDRILAAMDLQGAYQEKNLRTALAALDRIMACMRDDGQTGDRQFPHVKPDLSSVREAIIRTAARTEFHGRWEKLSDQPYVICDIGHNAHGLKYNFAQLSRMLGSGDFTHLVLLYGSVADKDLDAVLPLFPPQASFIFTQAASSRSLPAECIMDKYTRYCTQNGVGPVHVHAESNVPDALAYALRYAEDICHDNPAARPLIYVGGSTYVVSEAVAAIALMRSSVSE